MEYPASTEGFSKPGPDMAMLFFTLQANTLTSLPNPSAHAKPISQGHYWK